VNKIQADALFRGFEGELAWRPEAGGLGARLFGDRAEGRLTGGSSLPRISPARLGVEGDYKSGAFATYASLLHVYRQDRVAPLESVTAGYTRLDAGVEYTIKQAREIATTLFLRGNNLTNQDMRVHTSFIKDFAPLPGRSIVAGARLTF
jgi:iron complex outermembrane receptor protein